MFNYLIWIFILVILFFIIVMVIDTHSIVIRNYEYKSSKFKKDFKIVLLTDLHGVSFGKGNNRLINKINAIKPDIIMIAGDLYTAYKNSDTTVPRELLANLALRYPVYYANGNHEYKSLLREDEFGPVYKEYIDYIKEIGINHLFNEREYLEEYNIDVIGLNLPFEYYKKGLYKYPTNEELDDLIGEPNKMSVNILLAHNPEYFKQYVSWGADLTLSGHYHGGLLRLPVIGGFISPRYTLFPKYDFGEYEDNDKKMILSCGLGTHTLPIRIFNPGEISVINCKK